MGTGILAKSGGLGGSLWTIIDVDIVPRITKKNVSATQKNVSSP